MIPQPETCIIMQAMDYMTTQEFDKVSNQWKFHTFLNSAMILTTWVMFAFIVKNLC